MMDTRTSGTGDASTTEQPVETDKDGRRYNIAGRPIPNAVAGLFVLLVLMVAMRLVVDGIHEGKESHGRFKEIQLSFWNVMLIGLLAVPGVVFYKFLVARFLRDGNPVRALVLAA